MYHNEQSIKSNQKQTPVPVLSKPHLVCSRRAISLMIYRPKPVFSAPSGEVVKASVDEQPTVPVGYMLGDVDGSNRVDIKDVTTIQRYLAELENPQGAFMDAANVNGDSDVNIADATILQMFLADHTVPYPIGEIIGNTETPTQPAT